jgi:hypothetical protein
MIYAKRNKLGSERNVLHAFSCVWSLKQSQTHRNRIRPTVTISGGGEWGEFGQRCKVAVMLDA